MTNAAETCPALRDKVGIFCLKNTYFEFPPSFTGLFPGCNQHFSMSQQELCLHSLSKLLCPAPAQFHSSFHRGQAGNLMVLCCSVTGADKSSEFWWVGTAGSPADGGDGLLCSLHLCHTQLVLLRAGKTPRPCPWP